MIRIILIIAIPLIFSSCSNTGKDMDKALKCIEELARHNGESAQGKEFTEQLNLSLKSWIEEVEIFFIQSYKEHEVFVSDMVLFDSSKKRGIGFIIEIRKEGEINDVVQIVTGEKIEGEWQFYNLGNPTLLLSKCDGCDKKYESLTIEQIERRMLENIIGLEYFKRDCVIDDEKFESFWITDLKRIDHKYRFLTSTYPKYHESFYRDGVRLPSNK